MVSNEFLRGLQVEARLKYLTPSGPGKTVVGTADGIEEVDFAVKADASAVTAVDAKASRLAYRIYDPDAYGALRGTGRTTAERTTTTAAINQAAEDARLNDGVLVIKGEYEINGTVQIRCHLDAAAATLTAYDTTLNPAVLVGARTAGERLSDRTIVLPHVIQAGKTLGAGWSGTDVGVEISNTYSCHITTQRISSFSTNLWLSAYGSAGNVYNDITLGHLENGKINLRLAPADAAGWVNQNTFIGGRCYVASAEGTAIAGVRHILIDTGTNPVNNNLFLNTSIEGNGPEYHVECFGLYNVFQNCRWEASPAKIQFNGANGNSNVVAYGYNAHQVTLTQVSGALYNHIFSRDGQRLQASAGTRGVIVAENGSSAADPVYVVMAPNAGPAADPATDYAVAMGANQTKLKRSTDAQPRIILDGQNGTLGLDDGVQAPRNTFTPVGGLGVRLNTGLAAGTVTSLPAASSTYRGMFLRVEGAAGVADALYICEKNAADAYVWRQI